MQWILRYAKLLGGKELPAQLLLNQLGEGGRVCLASSFSHDLADEEIDRFLVPFFDFGNRFRVLGEHLVDHLFQGPAVLNGLQALALNQGVRRKGGSSKSGNANAIKKSVRGLLRRAKEGSAEPIGKVIGRGRFAGPTCCLSVFFES